MKDPALGVQMITRRTVRQFAALIIAAALVMIVAIFFALFTTWWFYGVAAAGLVPLWLMGWLALKLPDLADV
jgi:hypothetical protein